MAPQAAEVVHELMYSINTSIRATPALHPFMTSPCCTSLQPLIRGQVDFVHLYDFQDPIPDGTPGYVAGWGRTVSSDPDSGSDQLKGLSMTIGGAKTGRLSMQRAASLGLVIALFVPIPGQNQFVRVTVGVRWLLTGQASFSQPESFLLVRRPTAILIPRGRPSSGVADVVSWIRGHVGSPVKTTGSSSSSHSPTYQALGGIPQRFLPC